MRSCSIIIPTLNEEENIEILLQRLDTMSRENHLEAEVVFVDDGSTDQTRDKIRSYQGNLSVVLVARKNKRGLSGAVISGARRAANETIVVMDADGSHPPEAIPSLLEALEVTSADIVIGSRYLPGATIEQWPVRRRIASLLAAVPARILTGARDPLAGFFATKKIRFARMDEELRGFKIGLELLLAPDDTPRVTELPIVFQDRRNGSSKMNAGVIIAYAQQLLRLCGLALPAPLVRNAFFLGMLAVVLDIALLRAFLNHGFPLATAHIIAYLLVLHAGFLLLPLPGQWITGGTSAGTYRRQRYGTVLTCMVAVLFLRAGLLATLLIEFPLSHPLFIGTQMVTSGLGWLLVVLALNQKSLLRRPLRQYRFWLVLVIGYSIILRLVYLGAAELIQEEAYYWNYAQHLDYGYLDHPPIVALLIHIGTSVFGDTEFGVRIGVLLCWFATAWFMWRFSRLLFNRERALETLVFLAVLPIFFGTGLVMTPDAPLMTFWAGTLYFLYRAFIRNETTAWLGVGVCLGLGLAAKYSIVLLGPAIIAYMVFEPRARKWFGSPYPYLAALIALAIFSPVILWNYQHDWASFLFQSQRRLTATTEFSLHELVGSILALLTPVGCWALLCQVAPAQVAALRKWWSAENSGATIRFIVSMTALPLLVFVMFSLFKEVKLSWTGPVWLAALPLLSIKSIQATLSSARQSTGVTKTWPVTVMVLLFVYGTTLHYFALGLPGASFPSESFLLGWPNLALQLERQSNRIEHQTGVPPVIVGMDKYRVASGLAFYQSKNLDPREYSKKARILAETTGSHLFGRNSLMYRYWTDPATYRDRTLLVLSSDADDLDKKRLVQYASSIGEIHQLYYDKFGRRIGPIYYRLLAGYKPFANEVAER